MASTYAHYKFGHLVIEMLPLEIKAVVERNIELFDIGLHGPDILFYYKPYKNPKNHNRVSSRGYDLHKKPTRQFFSIAMGTAQNGSEADMAYALGFITHFVLDTAVHSYIQRVIELTGLSHIEIENEFDRAILIGDEKNPLSEKLCEHIVSSYENAVTVSHFWSGISPNEIEKSMQAMKFYSDLLVTGNYLKRGALKTFFKATGHYKQLHGLLIGKAPNPRCKESNRQLEKRFNSALVVAKNLIWEFYENKPLAEIYDRTFSDNGCDI